MQRQTRTILVALTLVYVALMVAGGSKLSAAFHMPHDPEAAVAFVGQNGGAIRWGSFCEFVSAIPLGIFLMISVGQLRVFRVRSAGEPIALLGAIATPMMMIGSALATWSLTRPGVAAAPGAVAALQAIGFDGGGPGFAVFLGLFVAGVSIATHREKRLPLWLMGVSIVVAAAGELSSLTLLNFTAGYLIPVARFLSIVWMLGLAFKLPGAVSLREADGAELVGPMGYSRPY
jgi:hypothetical protein